MMRALCSCALRSCALRSCALRQLRSPQLRSPQLRSPQLRSPGLLLRQAVQRSESPNEIDGVDTDDATIGEEVGERVQGEAGVRGLERRDAKGPVRVVENRLVRR